jgi:hypothetical protein
MADLRRLGFHGRFAPSRLSQLVVTCVHSHSGQPSRKVLIRFDLVDPSKQLQKHVLRDVFNILARSEEPADQAEHHRGKLIHDGFLSCAIRVPGTNQQVAIKFHKLNTSRVQLGLQIQGFCGENSKNRMISRKLRLDRRIPPSALVYEKKDISCEIPTFRTKP